MTDQELDRVLAAAVNVDHSPEFFARVRSRVADEQIARWPLRWPLALAGAALSAAALIAAIVAWPERERSVATQPPVIAVDHEPGPAPPVSPPSAPAPRRASVQRNVIHPRPQPALRLPEILISPEDARAFDLLIASAQARRIPELPTDSVSARNEVTLPPIEVPPVMIEPLPEIARLEGERPR